MKFSNENFITIAGWMVKDLGLSGNELIIYATIYSFSQDGESTFYGSRQYLAEWCNCSLRTVQNSLNTLIEMGLIEQVEVKSGVFVKYRANRNKTSTSAKPAQVPVQNLHRGSAEPAHDSIEDRKSNIENNIILKNNTGNGSGRKIFVNDDVSDKEYTEDKKEKKLNLYEKCMLEIDNFTQEEKLNNALKEYLPVRLRIQGEKRLLGLNQWKGILRTLKGLNGDKVAIVQRATERGWASFFEIKDYRYRNYKTDCSTFGETEDMKLVRPEDVEGGESSGVVF